MKLKIIKTNEEYNQLLNWVDEMFDKKIKLSSPEGEALKIPLLVIKEYEEQHFPIPKPSPPDSHSGSLLNDCY